MFVGHIGGVENYKISVKLNDNNYKRDEKSLNELLKVWTLNEIAGLSI